MVLVSSLVVEHMLVKSTMSPVEMRRLAVADMVYGASAAAVLIAGLLLWFYAGKGAAFYTSNPVFHVKVAVYILVAVLSIYPTVFFMKNRKSAVAVIPVPKSIIMIVRFELLMILIMPFLAVTMAQGYRLI